MKLGTDFFLWIRILIAILTAIKNATLGTPDPKVSPGAVLVKDVLDIAVNANSDDEYESVAEIIDDAG